MSPQKRILVVDDESDICEILKFNLEKNNFIVDVAYSAEEALENDLSTYNLFILDVMMGKISGFNFAKITQQKFETAKIPIIFITAKDTIEDKLVGFNIGADEYISKSFSISETLARIENILKRYDENNKHSDIKFKRNITTYKGIYIDENSKTVTIDNKPAQLTKKEYELLVLFLHKPNKIFSRNELLQLIWDDDVYVLERTIDVNIARLRNKITPYEDILITKQGYGYKSNLE